MLKLAANINYLFTELPFLERFSAAAENGFTGIEILMPYEYRPEEVSSILQMNNLECVLINTPYGDMFGGHTGLGAISGREKEFYEDANRALDYAVKIDCRRIHALAGIPEKDMDFVMCREIFITNLRVMAELALDREITILIEPLNVFDFPGYFLTSQEQAQSILIDVGMPNVALQMDFYHCQIMEGDLTSKFNRFQKYIGHIQIAGVPGRNEPFIGEINYPYILEMIESSDYSGWVGAEYIPKETTTGGLHWAKSYGIK